jgi:hypothetical protein
MAITRQPSLALFMDAKLPIADAIDDLVIAITATEGMRRNKCPGRLFATSEKAGLWTSIALRPMRKCLA